MQSPNAQQIPPTHFDLLDYPKAAIVMQATNVWEREWRLKACTKEPWTMAWLDSLKPGGDVLYNVGACVGSYALIAAKRGVQTVACEPGYANYGALCANVLLNGLNINGPVLIPLPVAIGPENGISAFAYRSVAAGAASHQLGGVNGSANGTGDDEYKPNMVLPVVVWRLDELVEVYGLPKPTALLIDVDRSEVGVLMGALETLRSVRTVMVELTASVSQAQRCDRLLVAGGLRETARYDRRAGKPLSGIYYAKYEREPDG